MSQTQVKNNNKKINKAKKQYLGPDGELPCLLTLILEIILCVALFGIALAPVLYILFGLMAGLFAVVGVIITTIASVGLLWTIAGFRDFWSNAFAWIGKVMDGQDVIVNSLKDNIVLISVIMGVAASSGFIVNLVFFILHKENKVKFILSCVFLGLTILNVALAIGIYLNWGSK